LNGLVTYSGKGTVQTGFVWGLNPSPTTTNASSILIDSKGKGPLTTVVSYDLKDAEFYFVRAFGLVGSEVVYGDEIKFQSQGCLPPVIETVDPIQGSSGTTITITGRNFSQLSTNVVARLNELPLTVLAATSTMITARIPDGFPYSGELNLSIEIAGTSVNHASRFTVVGPIITGFQSSRVVGGDTITIAGSGFSTTASENRVQFATIQATLLTATSTQLTVVVPTQIIGDYPIDLYINDIRTRSTEVLTIVSPWTEQATSINKPSPSQIAVQFTVGSNIITGLAGSNSFWKYVPSSNTWSTLSAYPGSGNVDCFGFSLGTKGYAGLGTISGNPVGFKDVWEYDSQLNTWAPLPDFPGQARLRPAQFVLNGKAYVGLGISNGIQLNDFWEFNPSNGTWTQLSNFPGSASVPDGYFSLQDKGYVTIGKEFWVYNPATDSWTRLGNTPQSGIQQTMAVIDGRGFLFGGTLGGIRLNEVWEYRIQTDQWQRRPNTITPAIHRASGIGVDHKIYLIGGHDGDGFTNKIYIYTPKP
jgi:hypothetical protein